MFFHGFIQAMLAKAAHTIEQIVSLVSIAFFALIFGVMLLQIFFRYVLNSPLVWTEELCRYLFVWICFLGWTIALRRGTHIRINFFLERLPLLPKKIVLIVFHLLILFFLIQLTRFGIAMTRRSFSVPTITLFFSWAYVYLAAPVSAVIMILYVILHFIDLLRGEQKATGQA